MKIPRRESPAIGEKRHDRVRDLRIFMPPNTGLRTIGRQYVAFCLVGLSGLLVDTMVLAILTRGLALGIMPAKLVSSEVALLNNFLWHEGITFSASCGSNPGIWMRLGRFHMVCMAGVVLGNLGVQAIHARLGLSPELSNVMAVLATSMWNFCGSAMWAWRQPCGSRRAPTSDGSHAAS